MNHRQTSVGGGLRSHAIFDTIVSLENLFAAWREFRRGKRRKPEVQEFEFNLEDNLFILREELLSGRYAPAPYQSFYITDPKLRHIHKAAVRDRVANQAVFRVLYPIFDRHFIFDSYSSRIGKGVHAGVDRLERFLLKTSANRRRSAFALKCDIRKFFDSVDHGILMRFIERRISDHRTLCLIRVIVNSFWATQGKGLPLGNVTSQLFANIYLNELDQFVKHRLKIQNYLRYCDDFVIINCRGDCRGDAFVPMIEDIRRFLRDRLRLELHPSKIVVRSYRQGIDFLGYVLHPYHRVLRVTTKRRLLRRVHCRNLQSYLGILSHCNGYKIAKEAEEKVQNNISW